MSDVGIADALRLGWHLAELRGRWRIARAPMPTPFVDLAPHVAGERTGPEIAIQVEAVARQAAKDLGVDPFRRRLSYQPALSRGTATARLEFLCRRIALATSDEARQGAWQRLTEFMWVWDLRIVDTLTANSVAEASAYQLARSFSEILWSNSTDYNAPNDIVTRLPTLTDDRKTYLIRYLERLGQQLDPLTTEALKSSLTAWMAVATDDLAVNDPETMKWLRQQGDIWHDLVLQERTGGQLLQNSPKDVKRYRYSVLPVLRQFWPQVAMLGSGFLVVTAAAYVSTLTSSWRFVSIPLGALGIAGFTSAGVTARLKNAANDLLNNLRLALSAELIAEVATKRPKTRHQTMWFDTMTATGVGRE